MPLDKIRDGLLIQAALVFLWVYGSSWVVQNFIEKAQFADKLQKSEQKVQQLEKQLAEKAKEEKK